MEPSVVTHLRAHEDAVVERLTNVLAEPAPPHSGWDPASDFSVDRIGTYPYSAIIVRWDDLHDGSHNAWRNPLWRAHGTILPPDPASTDPQADVQAIAFRIYEGLAFGAFRYVVAVDSDGTVWVDDEEP